MDVSVSIVAQIFKKSAATIHNWLKGPEPRFTYHLDISNKKMINFDSVQKYVERNVLFNTLNKELYKHWLDLNNNEDDVVCCPHCKKEI